MTSPIALITGASKGIGAATALTLAESGYDVWLNYRGDHFAAEQVKAAIVKKGRKCKLLPFDVADKNAVRTALEPLLKDAVPYVLVNNAGYTKDGLMMWMDDEDWNGVLDVHLNGFFYVTKCVLTYMLRKREGRIINMVSTSGETGVAGQVNYSAAKSGLIGATKSLAREVAKRNVLVNAVSPGFIETEMTDGLPKEKILPMIPVGRMGTARDVAGVVRFLCSEDAGYITGQVLSVNGGVHM